MARELHDPNSDDEGMYVHSACHVNSPTWAILAGDVLTIECATCHAVITRFRVLMEDDAVEQTQ